MAFASVISLKNIIERLLIASKIYVVPGSPEIIETLCKKLESLQEILKNLNSRSKRMDRKRINALDEKIKEVVSKFEDMVESLLSNQISSQSGRKHALVFCIDLGYLTRDVDSFIKTVEKMEEEYVYELENMVAEEEDEEETAEFGGSYKSKMVGLSDLVNQIRDDFTLSKTHSSLALSLLGMAGIGKTALAMEIFYDPLIMSHFDCRAWVKVGRLYKLNEIPRSILSQVDDQGCREGDDDDDDGEKIKQNLYEYLKDKRFLIVLDDVWETEVFEYLRCCFPKSDDVGSRILITTRLMSVANHNVNFSRRTSIKTMRLLNDEESWNLLHEKVFGEEEWCHPKLEEAGKKIAKKCDGLPLTIIKVAELLSKRDITVEYWNEVAAAKEHSIFGYVYGEISKIIWPSYEYLPQGLKACILYMGVFMQDNSFSRSKLIDMWIAEGFLVPNILETTLEGSGTMCLVELVSNSLVMVCEKSTILSRGMKTCRLHASLWHFCRLEIWKNKFFTVLNSLADASVQGLKGGQRRLSINNNILLGIKDVFGTIEDECAFTARSLLCLGPYHRYPLRLCFGMRFLRVLRALSIRLYEFPMEVLDLVQLRYLALTFNGDLPSSVSRLFNLQFLIIHRHLSILSSPSQSYLPVEIWDMKELIYLHVMGSDLPVFTRPGSLENIRTLLDVGFDTCTESVLRKISNLKKLGIRIELVPDDETEFDPFRCLDRIFLLQELESFKCVVVNPELKPEVVVDVSPPPLFRDHISHLHKLESPTCIDELKPEVVDVAPLHKPELPTCIDELKPEVVDVAPSAPLRTFHLCKQESPATSIDDVDPRELRLVHIPAPVSTFPASLRKMHLSGLCCPWEAMDTIGSLPYLQVLKLQCYAFQGPKWEVERNKFPRLEFLVIDDADLVEWEVGSGSFPRLRNISIKHCYNLQEFHWDFYYYFKKVEIVDSNPSVKIFFEQLEERRGGLRWGDVHRFGNVRSLCSWDDGKLKST